jgi:hypothetical protein
MTGVDELRLEHPDGCGLEPAAHVHIIRPLRIQATLDKALLAIRSPAGQTVLGAIRDLVEDPEQRRSNG